ncbi:FAD-dependent monooxygenase [Kitasatospora sp. NPDC051853]|uniref:FAD-dependent monooxygenase n=1 Tax=Kitasatospora sp. NPDC051853 TaxID=3364058 RepID=UPI00378A8D46
MAVDVAIVGGGPVGMLLAGELALHGVRVLVLEQLPSPTGESKAGTLHARTAQTLHRRGLLEAVQPGRYGGGYRRQARAPFHFGGIFGLDLAAVVDEGPALVGSPQAHAEQVFADRAERLGAVIRRGARVTGLTDHGDRVTLTLDGGELLDAAWVVGCDGARSTVRRAAGIAFTGTPATMSCLMGEVRLRRPELAPAGWQRTERGWTIFWVDPNGHSRIGTYDFRGPAADRQAPVTLEELRGEAERITGQTVEMDSPRWLSRFSDAALQAERYRAGRVLLAGDAAHVHFPAGGQGLNTGLQDAVNLAWKLAGTVAGWAPEGLLDSYHAERHPVAAEVLWNVRAQVALMDPDPKVDPLRELFGRLMRAEEVNHYLSGLVSGTAATYPADPGDPLAGRFVPDLPLKLADGSTAELAALLHPARPVLLDLADDPSLRAAAEPWADRLTTVTAALDTELTALLVRPDGYAAWSSASPVPLTTALARWFGAPAGG